LVGDNPGLIAQFKKRHGTEIVGFSQELAEMSPEEVAALSARQSDFSKTAPSAFTDLRLPLVHALEHSGSDQGKILGVVLLTDGQHNWGPLPSAKATELGKLGVPIFPIALGAHKPPTDIALTSVQAPTSVFKNSEVPVEARFQVTGLSARELVVTL